jgi:ATP-dependent RNA helicase DDX3X
VNGHVSPFGGGRRNDNWAERPHNNYGGGGPRHDSGPRETFGYGVWRDGQHVVGGRNVRLEKELYGDAEDPSKQHTGINFEKYDDIPVEATGAGVPEAVTAFTSPPLDPVLVENIGYARYTTPTPVQKYSIPIVTAKRDLMACAQVRATGVSSVLLF